MITLSPPIAILVDMWRRSSIIFFLIASSIAAVGQEQLTREEIDAVIALPYDRMTSNLDSSKTVLGRALASAKIKAYRNAEADLHSRLGIVTYLLGEHEASLEHSFSAIELYDELGLKSQMAGAYCSVGYQMKRRDMAKANEYMRIGLNILKNLTDTAQLETAFSNYGVLKEIEGQLDSASFYYNAALGLVTARNDSVAIPFSLNHLAGIELLKENFDAAKALFDQAFSIRNLRKDDYGVLENTIFYGDLYKANGKPELAINYYYQAIELSYKVSFPYLRQYCFEQLAVIYEESGDAIASLKALKSYTSLKDSLLNIQRTKQLAELETRFETADKERENLELKQQKAEQNLAISRQRLWIFGLIGLSLIVVLLGLFIVQSNRRKEAAKRDAAIIEEREKGLRAIIDATEHERKRIAKDLHDGIVQTLTGLSLRIQKLSSSNSNDSLSTDLLTTRSVLDESISEVRGISHQMMPRALNDMGLIPALEDMLEKSLGVTEIDYEFEHHGLGDSRFEESIEISLYRIGQELVNNIIKHANAHHVSVQLIKANTHLILIVEDNGNGFDPEDPDLKKGIGLMNIQSRASVINGEVSYESSPNGGTVVSVRVPCSD